MYYYIYVLENEGDRGWYIGYTSNLKRRVLEHQSGKGSATTRHREGWKLVYFEGYLSKEDAMGRERFLKSGSGRNFLKKQLKNYLDL